MSTPDSHRLGVVTCRLRRVLIAAAASAACMGALGALAARAKATSTLFAATWGAAPQQIAIDSAGNLYTSDYNSDLVSRITADGHTGFLGYTGDSPYGIAIDSNGNVFTTNYAENSVTKIGPDGSSSGTAPGYVWATTGTNPYGIVLDPAGNVYVTNQNGGSVTRIAADGTSSGAAPGYAWAPTGVGPSGIAIDKDGNLYTANKTAGTVTKIARDGTSSGSAPDYVWATVGPGSQPDGIAIDSGGNLYTANEGTSTVTKIAPDGTVTDTWPTGALPRNVIVDASGNVFVSNAGGNSITRINTGTGESFTIAPLGGAGPLGMVLDSRGNLYVANSGTNNITRVGGRVAPAPPQVPSAPTATAGALSASVTVPANLASAIYGTPTSYTVSAVGDASKDCTVTPPATSCEVAGLAAGTSYTFTARANLDTWQTAASAPSNAVVPTAPPGPGPEPPPSNIFTLSRAEVAGRVIRTTITVPGPGKIFQRGATARSRATACSTTRTAQQARSYTLACRVGPAAQDAREHGPVRVVMTTTFTPTGATPRKVRRLAILPSLMPRRPAFTG